MNQSAAAHNRARNSITTADYLRVTVVAAWGLALLWLLSTRHYTKFITPDLWWLLLMGAGCAFVFLLGLLAGGRGHSHHHGAAGSHWVRALVVLLPLAFIAVGVPQGSLGSDALRTRALDAFVSEADAPDTDEEPAADGPPGPLALARTPPRVTDLAEPNAIASEAGDQRAELGPPRAMTLVDLMYELDGIDRVAVTTEGMIFHSRRLADDQAMLFRFLMTCCAADAQPMTLILEHPDARGFDEDTWLRVTGVAEIRKIRGARRAILIADTLEQIAEPAEPYLSPF
jgi:putative membrane protein